MHQQVLFLSKYLRALTAYNGDFLDIDESTELAKNILPKIEMHDCESVTIDTGERGRETHYKFYVKVGSPSFRGAVNFTLPSHSLYFNSKYPTDVRVLLTGHEDSTFTNLCNAQMENWEQCISRNYTTTRYLNRAIPVHPHVSDDGQPCLGGWANAWSSAVNSGQIPSLVNVMKSFLNTWTSNDAYWNINGDYREWRYLPDIFKKAVPFTKWLTQRQLIASLYRRDYDFTNIDNPMPRRRQFGEWIVQNTGQITEYARMYDFDDKWGIRLMNLFYGIHLNKITRLDTECDLFKGFTDFYKHIEHIFYKTQTNLTSELGLPDNIASNLAAEAMIDKPKAYQLKPWYRSSSQVRCPMMYYNTVIQDARGATRSNANTTNSTIDMSNILDFQRGLNKGIANQDIAYLDRDEGLKYIAYFLGRNDRMYNSYETIVNFSKLHGNNDVDWLRRDDCYAIALGVEQFVRGYKASGVSYARNSEATLKYAEHFTNVGIKNYTDVINEFQNRRLLNARDKYKSIVRDSYFGDDSEQNQLSAF